MYGMSSRREKVAPWCVLMGGRGRRVRGRGLSHLGSSELKAGETTDSDPDGSR